MAIYICKNWYGKDSAPVVGSWTPKTWTGLTDFEGQDTIRIFSSGSALSDRYYIGPNHVFKQLTTANEASGNWTAWSPSGTENIPYNGVGRDVFSYTYSMGGGGWQPVHYISANVYINGASYASFSSSEFYVPSSWDMDGYSYNVTGRNMFKEMYGPSVYFYGEKPYTSTGTWFWNDARYSYKCSFTYSNYEGIWSQWSDDTYSGDDVWNYSGSSITSNYWLVSEGSYQRPSVWTGLTNFYGKYIWRDSLSSPFNIYYSKGNEQYMLDKTAHAWTPVSWNGLKSFDGNNVWHFNGKVFYSKGTDQYELVAS